VAALTLLQWTDLTTRELAAGSFRDAVAILPVAAVEQHGPHLPLGTDVMICQGVLAAACALLPAGIQALILPMQPVGSSAEHGAFPGTLSLPAQTLIGLWTAIGEGVHRAGLRKMLIFNSHGGQAGMPEIVGADLRARLGMIVAWGSPGAFGTPDGAIGRAEAAHGLHGGLKETAMMLHLRPDLVRMEMAADFASSGATMEHDLKRLRPTGRTGFAWRSEDLNPAGVMGNAGLATPELGARLVAHAAAGLAELIGDLATFELPSGGFNAASPALPSG
jgi:creatinine amidohydrolase